MLTTECSNCRHTLYYYFSKHDMQTIRTHLAGLCKDGFDDKDAALVQALNKLTDIAQRRLIWAFAGWGLFLGMLLWRWLR